MAVHFGIQEAHVMYTALYTYKSFQDMTVQKYTCANACMLMGVQPQMQTEASKKCFIFLLTFYQKL